MRDLNDTELERRLSDRLREEMDTFVPPFDSASVAQRAIGSTAARTSRLLATPIAVAVPLVVATIALAALATVAGLDLLQQPVGSATRPKPTVDALPTAWPPLPADPTFTQVAREDCLPRWNFDQNTPVLFQDRRTADRGLVFFRSGASVGWCEVERQADGSVVVRGSALDPNSGPSTTGLPVGQFGLAIRSGMGLGAGWNAISGTAPAGSASIRLVVGGKSVEAVVGDGHYSVSWEGSTIPTLLAAYDASGHQIDSIGATALQRLPSSLSPSN
jgi:hypothetical protein